MRVILSRGSFSNADELAKELEVVLADAQLQGHRPDTVYLNCDKMYLFEDTLTDGSKVLNMEFVSTTTLKS